MASLSFYGRANPAEWLHCKKLYSLQANNKGATVYILPPQSGDQNIPSDEEQCDEHEDELFEPAGDYLALAQMIKINLR